MLARNPPPDPGSGPYPWRVRLLLALYRSIDHLVHELMKFGVVGAFAFVVDVGLFNVLMYAGGEGPLNHKPLTAKALAVIVATTVSYLGNRHWTFRHRGRRGVHREYLLFFLFNGVGLVIALSCLGFSRYVLGLEGPLPDNIAANVIGLGLATTFRFWSYRRWVFPAVEREERVSVAAGSESRG